MSLSFCILLLHWTLSEWVVMNSFSLRLAAICRANLRKTHHPLNAAQPLTRRRRFVLENWFQRRALYKHSDKRLVQIYCSVDDTPCRTLKLRCLISILPASVRVRRLPGCTNSYLTVLHSQGLLWRRIVKYTNILITISFFSFHREQRRSLRSSQSAFIQQGLLV